MWTTSRRAALSGRLGRLAPALPVALALVLGGLGAVLGASSSRAVVGAAVVLLLAAAALLTVAYRTGRVLTATVALRKQHYLQACAQGTVLLYWGWSWRPVYDALPLLAAQILFAYAFDMLLAWARRDDYTLGFGPVPVVFSTNLFLWFKPEWFALQFVMLGLGFCAKELIRWHRDGRLVHIFNPSSFPLALVSLVLLVTGTSDITRGPDIAVTQFYPPHMYALLFAVGLPGQFLFGVASMTLAAVTTTWLLGAVYFAATGTYFFYDADVPIAVFLGMHLLFTDPSTSPRSERGRLLFGALYGLSSMVLYQLLTMAGAPAHYDKLLQVPLLNLSVRWLDREPAWAWLRALDPARIGPALTARQRHLAYMSVWAMVFAVLTALDGLGDRHPGQWHPFWDDACKAGRPRACAYLDNLEQILCDAGSGWACNESALRRLERVQGTDGPTASLTQARARQDLERGCRLGFAVACQNARGEVTEPRALERAEPSLADYRILVRGSKGPVHERAPDRLYAMACERGWRSACDRAALTRLSAVEP